MNKHILFVLLSIGVEIASIVVYIGGDISSLGFFCVSTSMTLVIAMQIVLNKRKMTNNK